MYAWGCSMFSVRLNGLTDQTNQLYNLNIQIVCTANYPIFYSLWNYLTPVSYKIAKYSATLLTSIEQRVSQCKLCMPHGLKHVDKEIG